MKLILYVTITLVLMATLVIAHETTHKQIYKYYNCTNITYGISTESIYTKAECPNNESALPNSINEIVGYTIIPFLYLISILKLGEIND